MTVTKNIRSTKTDKNLSLLASVATGVGVVSDFSPANALIACYEAAQASAASECPSPAVIAAAAVVFLTLDIRIFKSTFGEELKVRVNSNATFGKILLKIKSIFNVPTDRAIAFSYQDSPVPLMTTPTLLELEDGAKLRLIDWNTAQN
jgi:hypothetical protein